MRLILLFSAVLATALSANMLKMYKQTQEKYHMQVLKTTPEADKKHFKEFCQFAEAVIKHNKEDPDGYKAEVNWFALMPKSVRYEWTGLNGSQIIDQQRRSLAKRSGVILEERQAPSTVDYSNKLPPVKNQGGCGSCWAFGAVVALEYQVNRNSNNIKSLSEQQYLDCTYEGKRDGCKGGWPTDCYTWSKNNGNMIASNKDYPYVQKDGACKTDKPTGIKGYSVDGFKYLAKGDANMLNAVANAEIGVISVAFGVVDDFFSYRSGVYSGTGCNAINHALDVVGYGNEGGKDYWKARNSWGGNWGDKGYVKVARGSNMCNIANYGHYPLVSGSDADEGGDDDDSSDEEDDKDDDEGDEDDDKSDGDDGEEKKTCKWIQKNDLKMKKKIQGLDKMNMDDAKKACEAKKECKAITCKNPKNCWLNMKPRGKENVKFTGYVKKCK